MVVISEYCCVRVSALRSHIIMVVSSDASLVMVLMAITSGNGSS